MGITDKTVFLVEDHPKVRKQLGLLMTNLAGLDLIGEVDSAEAALDALEDTMPSLLLIDISLPGMSGIELVKRLHELYENCRCLMVSGHIDPAYIHAAERAGAKGFVAKGDPDELLSAVEEVLNGGSYWSIEEQGF